MNSLRQLLLPLYQTLALGSAVEHKRTHSDRDVHLMPSWKLHIFVLLSSNLGITCDNPMVVVLFPSPRGVGVTPATTMYFPFGLSLSLSSTFNDTLALSLPYGSSYKITMYYDDLDAHVYLVNP